MDYVEEIKTAIEDKLKAKGYSTSGQNGAKSLITDTLLEEIGKLKEEVDTLRKELAKEGQAK